MSGPSEPRLRAPVLEARGLVKEYKRVRAVDGIDLTVDAGERVALLGPNGAGKTTTLLMLLGVITPDAGEIEIVGRHLPKERSAAMEQVGFAAGYLGGGLCLLVNLAWIRFPERFGLPAGPGLSPAEQTLPARLALLSVALERLLVGLAGLARAVGEFVIEVVVPRARRVDDHLGAAEVDGATRGQRQVPQHVRQACRERRQ